MLVAKSTHAVTFNIELNSKIVIDKVEIDHRRTDQKVS
jgi:hypothetical protein